MASCRLLTLLPSELRLSIYKNILVRPLRKFCPAKKSRPAKNLRPIKKSRPVKKPRPTKHKLRTAILRTCRQIYDEAFPVLLSANTWVIQPSRADHTWLFGLGPQGQNTLRKIVLEVGYGRPSRVPESFHFEIFNTLPSCTRLSLTAKANTFGLSLFYRYDTMKYLHGFAKVTMNDLFEDKSNRCREHRRLSKTLPARLMISRIRTWRGVLHQLTSACPEDCEMHVGRPAAFTQSTILLDLASSCFYCEERLY